MSHKPNITLNYSCIYTLVSQDILPGQDVEALNLLEEWHTENKLTIWVSQNAKTKALLDMEQIRYQDKMEGHGRYQQWVDIIKLIEKFAVFGKQSRGSKILINNDVALGIKDELDTYRRLEELIPIDQGLIGLDELFEHYSQKNEFYICNQIDSLPGGHDIVISLRDELDIVVCSPGYAVGVLRDDFGVI